MDRSERRAADSVHRPGIPAVLAQTTGAPPVLFVLGSVEVLHSPQLAMVGSRTPPPRAAKRPRFRCRVRGRRAYCDQRTRSGIDAASHEGALPRRRPHRAVFGTGLDHVYPSKNAGLAARIRECGALVSEFPPRTGPWASTSRGATASSAGFHEAPWWWRPSAQRLPGHCPAGRRAGPRSVRDTWLYPQSGLARLSPAHP